MRLGAGLIGPATIVLGLVSGCSSDDSSGTSALALRTGAWSLPEDVRVAGEQVRVPYNDVSGGCKGSMTEGARILGDAIMDKYPVVTSVGGYACRANTANTSKLSIHAMGRALDIMIPEQGGGADSENGDPIANYLVTHAEQIGIQLIIWNHSIWRANGSNEGPYHGPVPHTDHIHAEITNEAADKGTAFFQNPVLEPDGPGGVTPAPTTPRQPTHQQPPDVPLQPQPQPEPEPTFPTPQPEPTFPTPQPQPTYPTPQPQPTYPTPQPEPTYPTPQPQPTYPTPTPTTPEPTPSPYPPGEDPTKPITVPYDGGGAAPAPAATTPSASVPAPAAGYQDDPARGDPADSIGAGTRASKPKAKPPAIESGCATAPGSKSSSNGALIGLALAAVLVSRRRRSS